MSDSRTFTMKWGVYVCLAIMSVIIRTVCSCPSDVCVCKWKGGKQTVECGAGSTGLLNSIPEGMDPGTQVLNFSGNSLQVLKSERFFKLDLINLQKIYLCRNQLIRIHDKAFRGLSNLVELDLSENMLTTVPSETFQDYSSLMRLTLSGNPIRELKTNGFRYLSFLTTLELSNCQIEKIEDEAFLGMDNLEWLRLDGNRIGTIRGNHILPKSLHGINLHGNRWNCDCKMIDMHSWLINYNVPQQIEDPKCMYPARLTGEVIKFLKSEELACLPDITPTTLYLELTEGRNISLLCKITSIPEATISWWFQGQLLQNDSFLEPNLHLYYYIEEGVEEKRSELYIFNTKPENNGTFSCVAENLAGRTQTNYTIRVIVKEEPIPEKVIFPYEYFLIIIIGAGVSGFLIVLLLCCVIMKCIRRSKKSKRRKESSKDSTIQLQNSKCSSIISEVNAPLPILKANGSVIGTPQQEMMMFVNQGSQNFGTDVMVSSTSQYCSPQTARTYHEQNPDLINDAESNKCRMKADPDDGSEHGSINGPSSIPGSHGSCENGYHPSQKLLPQIIRDTPPRFNPLATLPRGMIKDMYQHQVDVHLNPGCFLGQDGYPIEYRLHHAASGLPVMSPHIMQPANNQVNYYRTLPHKPKNQLAATQGIRYSMEAEFLSRTATPPFDAYSLRDMRYTAEGYPMKQVAFADQQQYPSPPDGYKSDATQPLLINTSPCQGAPSLMQQWPPCLPGYHHSQIVPIKTQSTVTAAAAAAAAEHRKCMMSPTGVPGTSSVSSTTTTVTKRCVGAQTHDPQETIHEQQEDDEDDDDDDEEDQTTNTAGQQSDDRLKHLTGPLADSPDEGYVGDSQDGSDM